MRANFSQKKKNFYTRDILWHNICKAPKEKLKLYSEGISRNLKQEIKNFKSMQKIKEIYEQQNILRKQKNIYQI